MDQKTGSGDFVGNTCGGVGLPFADIELAPGQNGELTFGDGVVVPAGESISFELNNFSGAVDGVLVHYDGDSVPSGSVPATAQVIKGR